MTRVSQRPYISLILPLQNLVREEIDEVFTHKEIGGSENVPESSSIDVKFSRNCSINFSNMLEDSYFNSHTSSTSSEQQSQCVCNLERHLQGGGSPQEKESKRVVNDDVVGKEIGFDDFWDN